jgi:Ca-activated chloride channel family protein
MTRSQLGRALAVGTAALTAIMLMVSSADAAPSAPPVPKYQPVGEPISGSLTAADAPEIGAGDWLDRLGGGGSERDQIFYTLPRTIENSSFHISATIPGPGPTESDGLHLEVINDQESCAAEDEYTSGYGPFIAVGAVVPADLDQTDDVCAGNEQYTVRITHGHPSSPQLALDRAVPVEIRIIEEPPAQGAAAMPEPSAEPDFSEPPTDQQLTDTHGSADIVEPTVLGPGGYSGTIITGEFQVFAVDLDWGQHLTAVARTPVLTNDYSDLLNTGVTYLSLRVYAPDRGPADGLDSSERSDLLGDEGTEVSNMTVPVEYANRGESDRRSTSIAGRYLVVLSLNELAETRTQVPYTLGIGVNGEPAEGPSYVDRQQPKGPEGTGATDGPLLRQLLRTTGYVLGGIGVLAVLTGIATLIIFLTRRR